MSNEKQRRSEAWIGDAVLSLYAREWILLNCREISTEWFTRMTSNQFLSCIGNPTVVEARIGRLYESDGRKAAYAMIEKELVPLFIKQLRNDARGQQQATLRAPDQIRWPRA